MADRNFDPARIIGRDRVLICGSFAPNGSSAVSAASNRGKGWSVARSATGKFTITLNTVYSQIDSVTASLQLATAADQFCQVGAITPASKTVVISVWDVSGAAVADVAANANNRINFAIVARTSSAEN